jgi:pyruvate/2-oxoacid:ferredoxin oxidoreductase alpha subunit
MATKISNAMFQIQTTNNIVIFPITPSSKIVATTLSNEKED